MTPRAERMRTTADGHVLQGIRCRACKARSFPPARFCRTCHGTDIEVVALATTGRIEAVSAYHGVAFGEVRLGDGMLVAGRIAPAAEARVGRTVRFAPDGELVRFEIADVSGGTAQ